jgi:hypothetical protein
MLAFACFLKRKALLVNIILKKNQQNHRPNFQATTNSGLKNSISENLSIIKNHNLTNA